MLVREFSEKGTFAYPEHLVHKGVTHIPAAKIF